MVTMLKSYDVHNKIVEIKKELQQEQEANKLPKLKEVLKELRVMFPNLFIR